MQKKNLLLLSIFSGVLLSLSWIFKGMAWTLFVAFLPLFFVEKQIYEQSNNEKIKFFFYAFFSFFIWSSLSIWWIAYATIFGAITAILLNTFYFTFIFWIYHLTNKKINYQLGFLILVCTWLGFEYFQFHWELDFPWLNLGNGFANNINLIQWYEYTGILGGSLWVLLVNILLFKILHFYIKNKTLKGYILNVLLSVLLIILPIFYSFILFNKYDKSDKKDVEIIVLQPNIDPYNEKFDGLSDIEQIQRLIDLSDSLVTPQTDYIVAPETAFPRGIWQHQIKNEKSIILIKNFIKKHPKLKFIVGVSSRKLFEKGDKISSIARKLKGTDLFYERYNSAIQIDSTNKIPFYHKSKLVVGVEKMPFPNALSFLEHFALDMGGTVGSLGKQNIRSVFYSQKDSIKVAPVICYESIFGQFVTDYVKNGANFIFIITNDAWWDDTDGYKQHLSYAKLRAIETRRSIARSANTGISAFINQRGEIIKQTKWWQKDAIKCNLKMNDEITFYTIYGDIIGRWAGFVAIILLLYLFVQTRIRK